jgi:L-aminopeptidase/D-esterase-like protein
VGKWAGPAFGVPGGLGLGRAADGGLEVTALAVVNPVGDVIGKDGSVLAGTTSPEPRYRPPGPEGLPSHTVLAVVATRARLDKREVRWLAARGSDGVTTAIRPAHTRYDGDVVFASVVPPPEEEEAADIDVLGQLATGAVAAAVRGSVSA